MDILFKFISLFLFLSLTLTSLINAYKIFFWSKADALIASIEDYQNPDEILSRCIVTFSGNSGEILTATLPWDAKSYAIGSSIKIVYNPADCSKAIRDDSVEKIWTPFLWGIVMLAPHFYGR